MNTNTDKNMTTFAKKFNAGDINYACGANQLSAEDKQYFINEHLNGCWGDVSKYQAAMNNAAVQAQKGTIISVHYNDATGEQIFNADFKNLVGKVRKVIVLIRRN